MTQLFSGITGVSSGAVDIVSPLVPGETAHPPQGAAINFIRETGSLVV